MDINKDGTVISNEGRVGKKEKSGKKKHKDEEYKDASLQKKRKRKEDRKDGRELEMRKKKRDNVAEMKTDSVDDNDEMGLIEANDQKKKKKKEKKEKKTKDDIIVVEEQKKVAKEKKKNVEKRAIEGETSIPNHSGIFDKSLDGGEANCKNQTEKAKKKKKDNVVHNEEEESREKKKKGKETKTNDEMGLIETNDQKKKKEKKEKKTKDEIIVVEKQKKVAKEKKKNVEKRVIREGETSIPNHSGIFDKSLDGGKANCKSQTEKAKKKKKDNVVHNMEEESREKKKKKKKDKVTNNNNNIVVNSSNPVKPKSKKVTFSDKLKVYPPTEDGAPSSTKEGDDGYVRGKRYTPEEDEIIKQAVYDYIDEHSLGEEGLEMVLNCSKHKISGCWNEICMALPHRPHESIYLRAHTLFERDDTRRWSQEEVDLVKEYHEKYGPRWAKMAKEMGKFRHHVKEVWRRIRLPNRKSGNWSQEEYQKLFELVNKDLQMKVLEEKKKRHSMLRDNIGWEAISTKLGTRATAPCCSRWYYQLTSPMVAQGIWSDADDYRLIMRLVDVDASCEEEVEWDNLLEHRSGDVCRQRWNQMWNHLGEHGNKTWSEQVDVLSKRYCPDLLEVREEVTKQREW